MPGPKRKGSSSNCPFADAFVVSLREGNTSTPSILIAILKGVCKIIYILYVCSDIFIKVRMVFGYLLAALPNSQKKTLPCDLRDKFSGWLLLNFPRSQILSQQQKKMVSFLLRRDILGFQPWGLSSNAMCRVGWIFLGETKNDIKMTSVGHVDG